MIVDAHHHLWDPSRRRYPFLEDSALSPIRRPYATGELREVTGELVGGTVLVQTVSDRAETEEFLAAAAASDGLIRGVVGWVDLTAGDVSEQIGKLRAGPGGERLVGLLAGRGTDARAERRRARGGLRRHRDPGVPAGLRQAGSCTRLAGRPVA